VISAKYTVTTEDDDGEEAEDIQTAVSNSFTITVSSAGTGILGFDITNNAITGVANAELE
jgi:molybdopterin biosynthesis enzyme MoaB